LRHAPGDRLDDHVRVRIEQHRHFGQRGWGQRFDPQLLECHQNPPRRSRCTSPWSTIRRVTSSTTRSRSRPAPDPCAGAAVAPAAVAFAAPALHAVPPSSADAAYPGADCVLSPPPACTAPCEEGRSCAPACWRQINGVGAASVPCAPATLVVLPPVVIAGVVSGCRPPTTRSGCAAAAPACRGVTTLSRSGRPAAASACVGDSSVAAALLATLLAAPRAVSVPADCTGAARSVS